ncbi:MAG: 50S ribosomal protein L11 methyltransferase [Planctomycetota bacterium]
MHYRILSGHLPTQQEALLVDRLAAADFHAYALSSRSDGGLDLACYPASTQQAAHLRALLVDVGVQGLHAEEVAEQSLCAPGQTGAPFPLCQGVWVQPGDDATGIPAGATVLGIPPGPAFGDGLHPTTAMAAAMLPADCSGLRVLDCGCGSGILGILAALRGAVRVDCCDCDPDAVRTSAALARAHGCRQIQCFASDLLQAVPPAAGYDLLVANIYAELLQELLCDPALPGLLRTGAGCILSGISHQKIGALRTALDAGGWRIRQEQQAAWWHAVQAERVEPAQPPS